MNSTAMHSVEERLAPLLRGGIRYRLFMLVILIILPLATLLGVIYQHRYETRKGHALQAELEIAHGLVVTFNAYLSGIRKQNLSVGYAISLLPPGSNETMHAFLITAVRASPSLRNMNWVSPEGVVVASSTPALVGKDLSRRASFLEVAAGSDLVLGDLTPVGVVIPTPTVTISTAIRDSRGKLRGVVIAAIEPTRLSEVVLTQKRPEKGALALFDSRGTLVYHSVLRSPSWEERISWRTEDKILAKVQRSARDEAGIQSLTPLGGTEWVSARVPIPGTGWVAGAGRPARIAFEALRRGLLMDTAFGTAVLGLAFLLAYILGRSITGPLLRLENDAQSMGEGYVVVRDDPLAPTEVRTLRETLCSITATLVRRSNDLRESEASLRTIFDNVYDGIVIHDVEGRIFDVNRRWLEMARLTRDRVEGLTVLDASAAPPPLEVVSALWRDVLAGETKFFEWRFRRPGDGSELDCEIFLCAIRVKGQEMVMANVRDITERKRVAQELSRARDELEVRVQERTTELAQAFRDLQNETAMRLAAVEEVRRREQLLVQQSRLAALGEMMGNIAHHWRQPLNIIGLMVQDLALSYETGHLTLEEMQSRTEKVMAVLEDLSNSIDDFRSLFTPDTAKRVFDVKEVVEKGLSLMSAQLQDLQVRVEFDCADGTCEVDGFRNGYLQVILNVLTNARDALREGRVHHPKITVRLFREDGRAVVTIADNGGGIEPAILEKIFDPYFSTRHPEKGTGIGLFMSKTIIEANMGGSLTVRNTGAGAEFRIEV